MGKANFGIEDATETFQDDQTVEKDRARGVGRICIYKLFRILLAAFLVSVPLIAIDAQASSGTKQYPLGGEAAGRISGYDISNVHYRLVEDTSYLSAVELDLDGPAAQVMIGFDDASDQTFTCTHVGQGHWYCGVKDVKVSLIYQLRVIAIG